MISVFLFFCFFSSSYACSTQTVAELESCKVKDYLPQILNSIRPGEEYVFEPRQNISDARSQYERLSMNNKPTIQEMRTELERIKDNLRPKVQFKESMRKLKYGPLASQRCGFSQPNYKILAKKLIKQMDQSKLTCLQEKDLEIKAEIADIQSKQTQREMIREALKNYDCETIAEDYAKQLCLMNKLRF